MPRTAQTGAAVEIHRDVYSVAPEWEALAERVDAAPFLRPGWFAPFTRAFSGGRCELVSLRRGGRLAAVLPLRRHGGVLEGLTNWHTPLFGAVTEDAAAAAELARALLDTPPRRFDVSFLAASDPLLAALRHEAEDRGFHALERVIERSPCVALSGAWEEFEARLPGKRRADLRRRRRRLEELGKVSIGPEARDAELAVSLADGFRVEALGWKGQAGTAIASDPATLRFYEELATWAASRGWLRLWFLRLDRRALAFAYCLVHGGSQYVLKVGYDPSFKRFAPGMLLTRAMLAHAFATGLERFEFLGQADPYKMVWTERCDDRIRVQLFAPSPAGLASRALWEYGRPVAKRALATARVVARS